MINGENTGMLIFLVIVLLVGLYLGKFLTQWYHEIPKRNKLLEEIRDELKKLNQGIDKE
ncbi:hypothetical protein [Myroides odoratimimus]|uniref:DUF4083 domain-containing protein n=1 Tax=Myroides odoratimimus CIP 101113 TaxID=883154 RepID=A0AAV3F5C5_9FLAO|nr:hypothetical protein [Myroides odoratimimus]EHO13837.1 hypothetical protein HMPREF9715_00911 [Myroides odoratimimus CIP 101113]